MISPHILSTVSISFPNVQTSFATSTHHHILVAPLNSALPLVPHQHPESPLNGAQAQLNKCRFLLENWTPILDEERYGRLDTVDEIMVVFHLHQSFMYPYCERILIPKMSPWTRWFPKLFSPWSTWEHHVGTWEAGCRRVKPWWIVSAAYVTEAVQGHEVTWMLSCPSHTSDFSIGRVLA